MANSPTTINVHWTLTIVVILAALAGTHYLVYWLGYTTCALEAAKGQAATQFHPVNDQMLDQLIDAE